jgi:plasmid stabilization system protein ParE
VTQVEFRSIVESELPETLTWYAARSNGTARRFLSQVELVLEVVAKSPDRYPKVGGTLRRAPVGGFPYAIYHGVVDSAVVVVWIVHGRRDPRTWRSRGE